MDYSPQTPNHSRSPSLAGLSSMSSPSNRRQSRSSVLGPASPSRASFGRQDALGISGFDGAGQGNNLADELADAFSESGDEDDEYYDNNGVDITFDLQQEEGEETRNFEDSRLPESPRRAGDGAAKDLSLGLPSPRRGHRRAGSEYDGSEYGSESDLNSPGLVPGLLTMMDAVEALARRGTEATGSHMDGVFERVTDALRDLESQAAVEGCATRLITAHSALTTHLTHQTRQLQNLSFPLLSPFVTPPDPETIDELLPLLTSLSGDMPRPPLAALSALSALHSLTSDLIHTLNYLSDTLHMSRQTTTTAARRLKSAKEQVAEFRREEELREMGEQWITRGNWCQRLERRECATVCGEVVGGFEEVCNDWQARLLAVAESSQA